MDILNSQNKVIVERANAAVLSRDYTLAARLYKGLLKNSPQDLDLLTKLGELYVKSGNDNQALPYFQEIINIDSKNINALNSLGAIYRRQKKYDESIAVLEQAVISDEENPQVFYNLGFTYKLMGKNEEAIHCFNTVVEKNPSDVLAWNHLGSIYAEQKKYDESIDSYLKGLKIDPNHPILHLNLAQSYEKTGRDELAIKEYESALRSKPGWLDAIDGYADLLLKKNKTRNASELVQKGILLNPKDTSMHIKMGKVYSTQSDFENAESEYKSALDIEPKNSKALSGLAESQENLGKLEDAELTMNRWEQEEPLNPDMLRQYAGVLLTRNKLSEASAKIKEVYDENPNDVHSLNLLGQYYICRGDENKAMGCFKKIRKINPDYYDFYKTGGKRFSQKAKYSKAQEFYEKFIEKNPDDSESLTGLAHTYELEGKYDEAKKYYKRLGEVDPDNFAYKNGTQRMDALKYNPNLSANSSDLDEIDNADDEIIFDGFDTDEKYKAQQDVLDSLAEEEGFDISSDNMDDENTNENSSENSSDAENENVQDSDENAETENSQGEMDVNGFSELAEQKDGVGLDEVFEDGKLDDTIEADGQEKYKDELEDLVPAEDEENSEEDFFANNPFGTSLQSQSPKEEGFVPSFSDENIDEPGLADDDDVYELEDLDDAEDFGEDLKSDGFKNNSDFNPQKSEKQNNEQDFQSANDNAFTDENPDDESFSGASSAGADDEKFTGTSDADKNLNGETLDGASAVENLTDEAEENENLNSVMSAGTSESDENLTDETLENETVAGASANNEMPASADDEEMQDSNYDFANQEIESDYDDDEFADDLLEKSLEQEDDSFDELFNFDKNQSEENFTDENLSDETATDANNSMSAGTSADNISANDKASTGENFSGTSADENLTSETSTDEINDINQNGETAGTETENFENPQNKNAFENEQFETENSLEESADEVFAEDTYGEEEKSEVQMPQIADASKDFSDFIEQENFSQSKNPENPIETENEFETYKNQLNQKTENSKSEEENIIALLQKLKNLSDYLPQEKKQSFMESKARLQLDYLISRLSGQKGLLAVAQEIRENLHIEIQNIIGKDGLELVKDVLQNSSALLNALEDRNLAAALNFEIEQVYDKL